MLNLFKKVRTQFTKVRTQFKKVCDFLEAVLFYSLFMSFLGELNLI